jgi:hypothetical protein
MFPSRLAFGFLEDIAKEFWKQYSSEIPTVVRPYSFIEFGRLLEVSLGHSRKHSHHPRRGNWKLTPLPRWDVLIYILSSETYFTNCSNTGSIRDDPRWTSRENSLELIKLSRQHK